MTGEQRVQVVALLKQGKTQAEISRMLGIRPGEIQHLRQVERTNLLTCDRCAEAMRRPSEDGNCGFCQAELAEAA